MTKPERPTFIMTNGMRNAEDDELYTGDVEERYRRIAMSVYKWTGLPDDVPDGFIERRLFDFGGISAKDVAGFGQVLFAVAPSKLDWYGQPAKWLPTGVEGIESIKSLYKESDNPVLWLGKSTHDLIAPYVEIMEQTLKVLSQNIVGLSQPVLVEGLPGKELDGKLMSLNLKTGKTFVPVVDRQATGLEVLDLKAQDHTQNLISTYKALHDTIMAIMGLMNGNNKTSGVNPVEQIADTQEIRITIDRGLELRQAWCDKINAVLGTDFWCEIADSWEIDTAVIDDNAESNDNSEDTDGEDTDDTE